MATTTSATKEAAADVVLKDKVWGGDRGARGRRLYAVYAVYAVYACRRDVVSLSGGSLARVHAGPLP